ncbi:MAG: Gfo/Idh/MocA family oxidoreductase [Oscillospiraceae bacterium]|nr:Gfo/Idh/MocA family oxidoreductase [Oscillospiraceae bacterium]
MDEIRLGTVGSGKIVHNFLDNVARTDGISLGAVYSRTFEKGKALADEYGTENVFTDMGEFLASPLFNTAYIATPNSLHYLQAKAALEAGKNVILEKPFCTTYEEAQDLAATAREVGVFLIEAFPTTFLPNYEVIRENIPNLGKIKLVLANYSQYSSRYDDLLAGKMTNIFDLGYAGGCLMDINYYNVELTEALFGEPVAACYYPNMYPGAADTSGVMIMEYDGFKAELAGAKDAWGVNYFQIEGEKGYIYIEGGSNGLKTVRTVLKDSDETVTLQEDPDRLFYEVRGIVDLISSGDLERAEQRLEATLMAVKTVEATRTEAGIFFPVG